MLGRKLGRGISNCVYEVLVHVLWAKDYAAVLRDDISPKVLQRKLVRLDLMSYQALIDSCSDIYHPLNSEKSQVYGRRNAPWWLLKWD